MLGNTSGYHKELPMNSNFILAEGDYALKH